METNKGCCEGCETAPEAKLKCLNPSCICHKCIKHPNCHQEKAGWDSVKNKEPWTSIEGVLWDIRNKADYGDRVGSEVADGMRLIHEYVSKFIQQAEERGKRGAIEKLFEIEASKWKDAEHCTCLGYAIVELAGGEDSVEGKKWEKKLLEKARRAG